MFPRHNTGVAPEIASLRQPMTVLAKNERIIAALVEKPMDDPSWDAETLPGLQAAFSKAVRSLRLGAVTSCVPEPPERSRANLRHDSWTASVGVSYVAGQNASNVSNVHISHLTSDNQGPGNIKHTEHNQAVLDAFLADPHVQRVMSHGNGELD